MTTIPQSPATVSLTQGQFNQIYQIKREEPTTAIRTIGVRVNPSGTTDTEFTHRLQYTAQWTAMINTSRLVNTEVIKAYRNVLIPSILYPLGAVFFSLEQCNIIQNLASQAYLPKLGFNRKLPKAILYGPSKLGG